MQNLGVYQPSEEIKTPPPVFYGKKILILAPHTDDGELGCGGTISKFINDYCDVKYVAFSNCGNPALENELNEAMKIFRVEKFKIYGFPVRRFNSHRQNILDCMVNLNNSFKPDIIFTPSICDIHQDHSIVTQEAIRAFKFSSIISYEMPWNNFSFNTNFFVRLEEKNIEKKCEALACYKSQQHRPYCNPEFIKSLARVRGTQINTQYAEAFEVLRWIQ